MTRLWQDFRGGVDGDPVTISSTNSGGIPPSFIIIDGDVATGPDISYSASAGSLLGYPMGVDVSWEGEATYLRWDVPDPDVADRNVMRLPVYFPTTPEVFTVFAQMRNASGQIMGEVGVDTSDRIYVNWIGAGMSPAQRFQAAPGTVYWVNFASTAGTTTSDGVIEMNIQNAAQSTLFNFSNAAVNTGTVPIQHYRAGLPGTNPAVTLTLTIPLGGLTMGDLNAGGWWPHLSPNNINIRPIADLQIGPGQSRMVSAELWNGEPGATWTWELVEGPTALFDSAAGDTVTLAGPSRWSDDRARPDETPIGVDTATMAVSATLGGETAPDVSFFVDILPQITWTRAPGGLWEGAKIAPACDDSA